MYVQLAQLACLPIGCVDLLTIDYPVPELHAKVDLFLAWGVGIFVVANLYSYQTLPQLDIVPENVLVLNILDRQVIVLERRNAKQRRAAPLASKA